MTKRHERRSRSSLAARLTAEQGSGSGAAGDLQQSRAAKLKKKKKPTKSFG